MVQADGKKIQLARESVRMSNGRPLTQLRLLELLDLQEVEISERTLQKVEATGQVDRNVLATIAEILEVSFDSLLPDGQLPWWIPSPIWNDRTSSPAWLLQAEMGIVPFHFRNEEMSALEEWCVSPDPLRVRLISGRGGMGKTRLALELCKRMRDTRGWRAGFLNYSFFTPDRDIWLGLLQEPQPLLLVLDYAESRVEIIDWLVGMMATAKPTRLRIVLLARSRSGDWWAELFRGRNTGALVASKAMDVHELRPVSIDSKGRARSYQLAAEKFAEKLGKQNLTAVPKDIDSPTYERVLLLHIQALANIDKQHGDDEDGILDYLLHRERRFWSERLSSRKMDNSLMLPIEEAMAAVTTNGGIKTSQDGLDLLRVLPSLVGRPQDVCIALNNLLHECYPGNHWIEPIQPDLFGERLSEVVLGGNKPLRQAMIDQVRKAARNRKGHA